MKTLDAWAEFEKSGFFEWMRHRLKGAEKKNPSPKLSDYSYQTLMKHLMQEMRELEEAIYDGDNYDKAKELGDVANMCAFVYCKIQDLNK